MKIALKFNGFSLAEVLIVVTMIGVIAIFTMPQLVGGVDEARYKAGVKKAYTTLANIAAMEKAEDNLPQVASFEARAGFFKALDRNLEVEGYAAWRNDGMYEPKDIKMGAKWGEYTFGDTSDMVEVPKESSVSPWLITADGMGYVVVATGGSCEKKAKINQATYSDQLGLSCFNVQVDVNGLIKGPNQPDPQRSLLTSDTTMKKLTGDRFIFYFGKDGIAKGSPIYTMTGRILSDVK